MPRIPLRQVVVQGAALRAVRGRPALDWDVGMRLPRRMRANAALVNMTSAARGR